MKERNKNELRKRIIQTLKTKKQQFYTAAFLIDHKKSLRKLFEISVFFISS